MRGQVKGDGWYQAGGVEPRIAPHRLGRPVRHVHSSPERPMRLRVHSGG